MDTAAVNARATTTVSILRGTTTNTFGDPADAATPIATGVQAAIGQERNRTTRPASRRPQTVRLAPCRLPNGTDVRVNDRIRDERTAVMYAVDTITTPTSPFGAPDMRLDLRRIT